jgi:predicted Zn finger-like uncharacterized protein
LTEAACDLPMFTVCPKCALTLVVTAADLRVAQGYVRCGRCSNVFNALARLSEDRQSAAAQAATPPPPSPPPPRALETPAAPDTVQEAQDEEPIPEAALEFNPEATDVTKVFVDAPPNPGWTAATGSFKAIVLRSEDTAPAERKEKAPAPEFSDADTQVDVEIDSEYLSAVTRSASSQGSSQESKTRSNNGSAKSAPAQLESDDGSVASAVEPLPWSRRSAPTKPGPQTQLSPQANPGPQTQLSPQANPGPQTQLSPQAKSAPQPQPSQESRTAPRPQTRASGPRPALDTAAPERGGTVAHLRVAPAELEGEQASAPSRLATLWSAGTVALVIILAAQIVNHYRNDLAANAQLNGPLTALYASLGIPLVPRWDLHAYDVRQLGASVDSASSGQIMVRASIKNGAPQAQPLPLLRVTLQDRFGNRIAARDVPPQYYLPRARPASSLLSAGQRIDAEMAFVDPGSNAVGFEIDACLPAPAGGIACANDTGAR